MLTPSGREIGAGIRSQLGLYSPAVTLAGRPGACALHGILALLGAEIPRPELGGVCPCLPFYRESWGSGAAWAVPLPAQPSPSGRERLPGVDRPRSRVASRGVPLRRQIRRGGARPGGKGMVQAHAGAGVHGPVVGEAPCRSIGRRHSELQVRETKMAAAACYSASFGVSLLCQRPHPMRWVPR